MVDEEPEVDAMVDEEPELMERAAVRRHSMPVRSNRKQRRQQSSHFQISRPTERNEPFLTLGKKYATELQIGCSNTIDLFFVLFSKTAELEE